MSPCLLQFQPQRKEVMFAHQAQHAPSRGADSGDPQPGPDLAMAFPMKRSGGEEPCRSRLQHEADDPDIRCPTTAARDRDLTSTGRSHLKTTSARHPYLNHRRFHTWGNRGAHFPDAGLTRISPGTVPWEMAPWSNMSGWTCR
jgi:hypothetical protein